MKLNVAIHGTLAGMQYVSELNFEECVVVVDYRAIRIYLVVPFLPYRN